SVLVVHSVRDQRPGGRERAHVDGHDDALAGAHLVAVQDHAVRADRRLVAGHGHVGPEFLPMSPEEVVTVGRHALEMTLMLAAPLLLTALAVGLIVGIFQAATKINEMTLSFIPKLLAMAAMLAIAGPWMIRTLVEYSRGLIESIPGMVG